MYEFEKHSKLTDFIQEMANTGKAPREWTSFIETLNQALQTHDFVGQSEQLPDKNLYQPCDGCTTSCKSWEVFFCKKLVG